MQSLLHGCAAVGHLCSARVSGVAASAAVRPSIAMALCSRNLYVKANAGAPQALEKLQMMVDREGIDKQLEARKRYVRPTLARQRNKKDAVYNAARRKKDKLIEEMLADPSLCPF